MPWLIKKVYRMLKQLRMLGFKQLKILKTKRMRQQHLQQSKKRSMPPTKDLRRREQKQRQLDLQPNRLLTQKRQDKQLKMPGRRQLPMRMQGFWLNSKLLLQNNLNLKERLPMQRLTLKSKLLNKLPMRLEVKLNLQISKFSNLLEKKLNSLDSEKLNEPKLPRLKLTLKKLRESNGKKKLRLQG